MAKHQIPTFTFTLGSRESIGPAALDEMWKRASCSNDVSVGREWRPRNQGKPVYILYAPQNLADLRGVELRLRHLLEAAHLNVFLSPVYG